MEEILAGRSGYLRATKVSGCILSFFMNYKIFDSCQTDAFDPSAFDI